MEQNDTNIIRGIAIENTGNYVVIVGDTIHNESNYSVIVGKDLNVAETASGSFISGVGLQVSAPSSYVVGKYGVVPEKDGTIDTTIYNRGSLGGKYYKDCFVICSGEPNSCKNVLVHTKYRWRKNPAYPWGSSSAIKGMQAKTKELPYIVYESGDEIELNTNLTINGRLIVKNDWKNVDHNTFNLDYNHSDKWKLYPPADNDPYTVNLVNWKDGCRGTLVVYNGYFRFTMPEHWVKVGVMPALQNQGKDIFDIYQVDGDVFIRHIGAKSY